MGTAGSVAVQRFPDELSKPADGSDFLPSPARTLPDCVRAARREAARYQSELFKLAEHNNSGNGIGNSKNNDSSAAAATPDIFAQARATLYDDAVVPEENLRSCVAFIVHVRKLLRLESNRTRRRRRLSGHGKRLFAQQFSASALVSDSSSDDGDCDNDDYHLEK